MSQKTWLATVLSVLGTYCLSSAVKVDSGCLVSRDLHDALVHDIPLPPRWHGRAPPARKKPGSRQRQQITGLSPMAFGVSSSCRPTACPFPGVLRPCEERLWLLRREIGDRSAPGPSPLPPCAWRESRATIPAPVPGRKDSFHDQRGRAHAAGTGQPGQRCAAVRGSAGRLVPPHS